MHHHGEYVYMCTYICASTVSKCTLMFRSMVRQRRLTLDTSLFVCRSTTLLSLDGGYWLQKTLHTPHRHVPLHTPCMCSFSAAAEGAEARAPALFARTLAPSALLGDHFCISLSHTPQACSGVVCNLCMRSTGISRKQCSRASSVSPG
jgi:hypothetical protein